MRMVTRAHTWPLVFSLTPPTPLPEDGGILARRQANEPLELIGQRAASAGAVPASSSLLASPTRAAIR